MKRLSANFMMDGVAMTLKFTHLSEALQFYDPEFFDYLKQQQADDLLFCYRWLLLEMKREFAFEDSLRMLEVLWSSLPPEPPATELPLFEKEFVAPVDIPPPKSPSAVVVRAPRENAYIKLCNLRRQSSSQSLVPTSPSALPPTNCNNKSLDSTKRLNQSLDENITRDQGVAIRYAKKSFQSMDETKMASMLEHHAQVADDKDAHTTETTATNNATKVDLLHIEKNLKNKQHSRSTSPGAAMADALCSPSVADDKLESTCCGDSVNGNQPQSGSKANIVSLPRRGHFKELKDRLAGKKGIKVAVLFMMSMNFHFEFFLFSGIFASLDKIENFKSDGNASDDKNQLNSMKMVKNFNEFLSFAPIMKSGISPKPTESKQAGISDGNEQPSIKLTKSSFDDSDSSSIAESNVNATIGGDKEAEPQTKSLMQLQFAERKQSSIDGSSPDDSQEYFPMTTSITRELRLELENLNRHVFGNHFNAKFTSNTNIDKECVIDEPNDDCETPESNDSLISGRSPANFSEISYIKLNHNSMDGPDDEHQQADKIYRYPSERMLNGGGGARLRSHTDENVAMKRISASSANADVFVWENPLHQRSPISAYVDVDHEEKLPLCNNGSRASTPDEQTELEYDGEIIDESLFGTKSVTPIRLLRKNTDDHTAARSNGSSKRSSRIYRNDSDSETSADISSNDNHNNLTTTAAPVVSSAPAPVPSTTHLSTDRGSLTNSPVDEEASEANIVLRKLPPPTEFGGGNPFLMFLCLTLLLQHRNFVIKNNMDYNEMAMHFDKMVRKHNVVRVLNQARRMYAEYIKSQNAYNLVGAPKTANHSKKNIKQKNEANT